MQWIRRQMIKWLIGSSDSMELNEIVMAVLKRYSQLYADEEVVFFSLPKSDPEERQRIIRTILSLEA